MFWVVTLFIVQAIVWAFWLNLASRHRVAEVPLAGSYKR